MIKSEKAVLLNTDTAAIVLIRPSPGSSATTPSQSPGPRKTPAMSGSTTARVKRYLIDRDPANMARARGLLGVAI